LLDDSEKRRLIDSLVEATNGELISRVRTLAAALSGQVASHIAYMGSLPWHISTANATPYTGSGNNGIQMVDNKWKLAPAQDGSGGSGAGQQPGTTERPPAEGNTPDGTKKPPPGTTQRPKDVPTDPAQGQSGPCGSERAPVQGGNSAQAICAGRHRTTICQLSRRPPFLWAVPVVLALVWVVRLAPVVWGPAGWVAVAWVLSGRPHSLRLRRCRASWLLLLRCRRRIRCRRQRVPRRLVWGLVVGCSEGFVPVPSQVAPPTPAQAVPAAPQAAATPSVQSA
jgi:hypothetical protein